VQAKEESQRAADVNPLVLALRLFLFLSLLLSFFPPTPNPLPSGKRALRFARPGFYFSPLLFTALKPTFLLSGGCKSAGACPVPFLILPFTSH